MSGTADRDVPKVRPAAWAWWGLVGALLGSGVTGLMTIGSVLLVAALVMMVVGARSPWLRNRPASMVVGGTAAAPLLVAWLNRGGPGTVCRASASETSCTDEWSPWPFLVVALVLLVAGAALVRWGYRRRAATTAPPAVGR